MNVRQFIFTRLLPFRARYWGMPWHPADARIDKKEWRFKIRNGFFFDAQPKKECLIHVHLYRGWRLITTNQYQLSIGHAEWEKVKKDDHLTVEYRESRIPDPLSGEKTIQIRIPSVPQQCKDENMDRPRRPGKTYRRRNKQE